MSARPVVLRVEEALDSNPLALLPSLSGVRIQIQYVPHRLDEATAEGVLWQASSGRFLLHVPGVARFLVEEGRSLSIDPEPGVEPCELRRFLRMTPLAALLYQRGTLAFHAAAATNSEGAVLLAGDSAAGKSALLMALVERGWTVLADDLGIVEINAQGSLQVIPVFPEIRLWPRVPANREPPRPAAPEFTRAAVRSRTAPVMDQFADSSRPLRAIHWLTLYNGERIAGRELRGIESFRALGSLTYHSRIADVLLDRSLYLRQAALIAHAVPIRRWCRPRGRDTVEELADRLVRCSIPLPARSARSAASGSRS